MKRVGFLYEKVFDKSNIKQAIILASRKKKHRNIVQRYLENIDYYTDFIHALLKDENYEFTVGTKKIIHTPDKERIITIPKFRDLVVQYAIISVIKPTLMRGMYKYSCGSIPKRGGLYAKKYTEIVVKKYKPKYALKLDIKKFFHNIDINVLYKQLERKIKDKKLLNLIHKLLIVGSDENKKGLPIGFYTSQWLSNFYLENVDHHIKEKQQVKYYARYVDDMILYSNNKRTLHKTCKCVKNCLFYDNCIELKKNYQLFSIRNRGVDFVGYVISYNKIKIRKRLLKHIKKRYNKIIKGVINIHLSRSFLSLVGWIKHIKSRLYQTYKDTIIIAKNYVSHIDKRRTIQ